MYIIEAIIVSSAVLTWLMTDIAMNIKDDMALRIGRAYKLRSIIVCDKCLSFWSGLAVGLVLYMSWECIILAVLSVVSTKVLKKLMGMDYL